MLSAVWLGGSPTPSSSRSTARATPLSCSRGLLTPSDAALCRPMIPELPATMVGKAAVDSDFTGDALPGAAAAQIAQQPREAWWIVPPGLHVHHPVWQPGGICPCWLPLLEHPDCRCFPAPAAGLLPHRRCLQCHLCRVQRGIAGWPPGRPLPKVRPEGPAPSCTQQWASQHGTLVRAMVLLRLQSMHTA